MKMSKNKMKQHVNQRHNQRSFEEGKFIWELEQIIETRTKQLQDQAIIEYLIKWKNISATNLTWEDESFIHIYPQIPKC